ncbi:MAG: N-acetyltransferase, partial [Caulobacteraceae bacterium]
LVLLVGDAPYFSRVGFVPAPEVRLPGPVNQKRVLVRPLRDGAEQGAAGPVTL